MAYTFSPTQISEIEGRLAIAQGTNNYSPLYDYIFWSLSDNAGTGNETPKSNVDKSVWLWVRGARHVNANDGTYFSNYIRDWTKGTMQ